MGVQGRGSSRGQGADIARSSGMPKGRKLKNLQKIAAFVIDKLAGSVKD